MSFLGILRHMNFRLVLGLAMLLNENSIKMVGSFMLTWAGKKAKMHVVML